MNHRDHRGKHNSLCSLWLVFDRTSKLKKREFINYYNEEAKLKSLGYMSHLKDYLLNKYNIVT